MTAMDEANRDEIIEESDAVLNMTRSDGWKIIEKWITARIKANISDLLTCPIEKIEEKRAQIKTLRSLFFKINEIIEAGSISIPS